MWLNGGVYDGRRIISEESVALATAPHTRELYSPAEREEMNAFYGYGWNVTREGTFAHGGSDGTWAWVDPAREIVGIVFTQSQAPGVTAARQAFLVLVTNAVTGLE
jgi:CubicO group peptidase (beta-lactamase class C family)